MIDQESSIPKNDQELVRADNDSRRLDLDRARLQLDHYRAELDRIKAEIDQRRPLVDGLIKFAEMTIRSLLLLNGGSALAVLTFAGHTYSISATQKINSYGELITIFGIGAATAVFTAALAYLAQMFLLELDSEQGKRWFGGGARILAICTAFASLLAFCYGVWKASAVFTS